MSAYTTVNILDMIDAVGEDAVNVVLSDFDCPKNAEIENFVKTNAIDFAKRKMSVTHLIIDEQGQLSAIFTLTHKALEIQVKVFRPRQRKRLNAMLN